MNESKHPENLHLSFFKHSKMLSILEPLTKTGVCEIFGVLHIKIFIFDNTVILTGANLQENYFTTRKD